MDFVRILVFLFALFVCIDVVLNQNSVSHANSNDVDKREDETGNKTNTENTNKKPTTTAVNTTSGCNGTSCENDKGFINSLMGNKDMLLRTLYVLIGVTSVVILYFVFRAWRLRGRKSKSRRYGLITTRGSDLEMTPLDAEDEEDDLTVFEVNGRMK